MRKTNGAYLEKFSLPFIMSFFNAIPHIPNVLEILKEILQTSNKQVHQIADKIIFDVSHQCYTHKIYSRKII